jgi:hypothetical protein
MSAMIGRRVSMSAVVAAALAVADLHSDELAAALAGPSDLRGADDGD